MRIRRAVRSPAGLGERCRIFEYVRSGHQKAIWVNDECGSYRVDRVGNNSYERKNALLDWPTDRVERHEGVR